MVFLKEIYAEVLNDTESVMALAASDILSFEQIKETDITGDYSPCGECTLVISDDAEGVDDILSLTSDDYEKLKIVVFSKWSDYVIDPAYPHGHQAGEYYINDITRDEANGTVTIQAYDILYKIGTSNYSGHNVISDLTYAALAQSICDDAGIPFTLYYEFPYHMQETRTSGYIPSNTYREALRLIGQAAGCAVFVDSAGLVTYSDPIEHNTADNELTPIVVLSGSDIVDDTIIESTKSVKSQISVSCYGYTLNPNVVTLASQKGIIIPKNSIGANAIRYTIYYDNYPAIINHNGGTYINVGIVCGNNNVGISPLYTGSWDWNPDSVDLILTNTTNADIETYINVYGYVYEESENIKTAGEKSTFTKTEEINNTLITNVSDAVYAARYRAKMINGNKRVSCELFGQRVDLVDMVEMPDGTDIIVDRISTKMTASDYRYTIEGYKYVPF